MKKVLCVALALMMVLSLSITTLAAPIRQEVRLDGDDIIVMVPVAGTDPVTWANVQWNGLIRADFAVHPLAQLSGPPLWHLWDDHVPQWIRDRFHGPDAGALIWQPKVGTYVEIPMSYLWTWNYIPPGTELTVNGIPQGFFQPDPKTWYLDPTDISLMLVMFGSSEMMDAEYWQLALSFVPPHIAWVNRTRFDFSFDDPTRQNERPAGDVTESWSICELTTMDNPGYVAVRIEHPGSEAALARMLQEWHGNIYVRVRHPIAQNQWQAGGWTRLTSAWVRLGGAPSDGVEWVETGVIPTNWRVHRFIGERQMFDDTGEIYLGRLTGDDSDRTLVFRPSYFEWQQRNTAGQWVTAHLHELQGVDHDWPGALREVHFNNANARITTNRTVGMAGRIRDVTLHGTSVAQAGPWTYGTVAARIRTPVYMTRPGSTNVQFDVSIRIDGRSFLMGRVVTDVGNYRLYTHSDDRWIHPNHRQYIRAEQTMRNLEIYAGEGVTFTRNLTGGQSVYVQASLWTDYEAELLFQQHAELIDIIDIHHYGFNAEGVTARITSNPRIVANPSLVYYVFDADRELIGTTADVLPFSTRYYIATSRINLSGVVEEAPAEEAA